LARLKKLWLLIVLLLVIGIFILSYSYYPRPDEKGVNVCLHLSDCGCSTISYLTELGVKWVRTDWVITDDSSMRDYSQSLQNNNINLLAIVNMSTFGDQISLKEWNETVTYIVTSEGFNNTDTIEVGNEPNNDDYYIPPETYYEMLKSAYAIIKNYAGIPVVFAGVSPNVFGWQDYLSAVFAYGDTEDYFDYMGIHFYDDMETNLETLQFVKSLTDKQIWLTETGKPSATENYNETVQAEYLSLVCSTFKPLVNRIFIYELKDNPGATDDKESHFGLLTVEGTQKEAYWIVCNVNRK
jgi:exo-beta-1,3-glucanase (GH17 family)